jgi:hypothetical protein
MPWFLKLPTSDDFLKVTAAKLRGSVPSTAAAKLRRWGGLNSVSGPPSSTYDGRGLGPVSLTVRASAMIGPTDFVGKTIVIDGRFRGETKCRQCSGHLGKAVAFRTHAVARSAVAVIDQCDLLRSRLCHGVETHPRSLDR